MLTRRVLRTPLIASIVFFGTCFCVAPAFSAPLSEAMRQADPRLQKKVTLVVSHILIGELLEKLSAQSGVRLTVGERDGAGDPEVLVSLKDVPLDKAMNALYSLVSYEKAEWNWEKIGEGSVASYRLAQPPAARELAAALRKQVQKDFEDEAKTMLAAVKMTPEERKQRIAELAGKDDASATLLKDNRLCNGLSIFANSIALDLQSSVLQGTTRIQVPVSQLSDAGRAFVHTEWVHSAATRNKPDGTTEIVPEPAHVFFMSNRSGGALTPTLYIGLEDLGAYGYVGGMPLEKAWKKKMAAYWFLPGDVKNDSIEARQVNAPKTDGPVLDKRHGLHNGFLQLSSSVSVPVIARLFNEEGFGSSVSKSPYGKSVEEFLTPLRDDAGIAYKWHEGILLASYNGWFMKDEDGTSVPWAVVKRLRDAEANVPDHFLPVSELIYAARTLSRAQLLSLSDYFPVMASVAHLYDLFSLMANSSSLPNDLQAAQGTTRGDALTVAAGVMNVGSKVTDRTARRVKMTVSDDLIGTPAKRSVMIDILTETGKVVTGEGFNYPKNQFVSQGKK